MINFVFFRALGEFPSAIREALRAGRRVYREMTERVIIVRALSDCTNTTSNDERFGSNAADGIVEGLFQACSFWVFVASATRGRASHVAERCAQGIGTSLAAAKSQGWKTE